MALQRKKQKRQKKFSPVGIIHIKCTPNNTLVNISDLSGNVLCFASGGTQNTLITAEKLKNAKKKTPYAAQIAVRAIAEKALNLGVNTVGISIKGGGKAREPALKVFKSLGLKILYVEDNTPIAHNGCRPPKKRRL